MGAWPLQSAPLCLLQASRLIVTFDEHVISNNFKFGVIYQKLGQVCSPPLPFPHPTWLSQWAAELCRAEPLPRAQGPLEVPPWPPACLGENGLLGAPVT